MNHSEWDSHNKQASIFKWADSLHKQAKEMFLKDKTHAHLVFSFKDTGLVSINPIPPKTDNAQVHSGIMQAIKQHNLYAVICIAEAWTYFKKGKKDHTAAQILDGEIKVSELRDEDKTEVLYLRMESRDGACVVFLDEIVRDGEDVRLGEWKTLNDEELKWF
ncbi:MAG: hypothetical protein A2283_03810 [Lentisphaerae bacterium RIFOXYA12_FULL_48_11]|nr:MAG: hypothetical protein A2283_03810 [Lentisphaerae bacterium RIFOXYA12_FULL_48_11]